MNDEARYSKISYNAFVETNIVPQITAPGFIYVLKEYKTL